MSYRSICNKCGRTGLGDGYAIAQSKIDHNDSCPNLISPTKAVKEETKVKKSKKYVPHNED